MPNRLMLLQLEDGPDGRVLAKVRDSAQRYFEIDVRAQRRGDDPRARVERFLRSLTAL